MFGLLREQEKQMRYDSWVKNKEKETAETFSLLKNRKIAQYKKLVKLKEGPTRRELFKTATFEHEGRRISIYNSIMNCSNEEELDVLYNGLYDLYNEKKISPEEWSAFENLYEERIEFFRTERRKNKN